MCVIYTIYISYIFLYMMNIRYSVKSKSKLLKNHLWVEFHHIHLKF